MKKIVILIICLILISGCQKSDSETSSNISSTVDTVETETLETTMIPTEEPQGRQIINQVEPQVLIDNEYCYLEFTGVTYEDDENFEEGTIIYETKFEQKVDQGEVTIWVESYSINGNLIEYGSAFNGIVPFDQSSDYGYITLDEWNREEYGINVAEEFKATYHVIYYPNGNLKYYESEEEAEAYPDIEVEVGEFAIYPNEI